MKNIFILLGILALTVSFNNKIGDSETKQYPNPDGVKNLLFYIQRTTNANTIVYTLNQNSEGELNEKEPIKAYWIKYAQNGKIDPLSYLQKNYAYGVHSKLIDGEKKTFLFEFVSYHKRQFYLIKSETDNKYRVYGYINNKLTILKNILVNINGGTFLVPNIKHVEVNAFDPITSAEIKEIIKP
ncbi:MAG: DUF4833 domain-containing protein [Bacteroidota bacterium]|nr:DUF4833 domain-containing protein [Bacteroidota bacterium]